MSNDIYLEKLEKKVWQSTFKGGLLEIATGIIMLGEGVFTPSSKMGAQYPLPFTLYILLPLAVLFLGRKYFILPRTGHVKFGVDRDAAVKKTRIILFVLALCYLIIITFPGLLRFVTGDLTMVVVDGFFTLILFSIIAYFMECRRLYLYASIWFASHLLLKFAETQWGVIIGRLVVFSAPGMILLLVGLVMLGRFLRTNPAPTETRSGE